MLPTNPFIIAAQALTSPNARAYYAMRAQQDTGILVWAIATAAIAAYTLGAEVADALHFAVVEAQPEEAQPLALPVSLEVLAEQAVNAWNEARAMARVIEAEIIGEPAVLAPAGCAGYLPAAKAKFQTNADLLAECRRLGLPATKRMKRAQLLELLSGKVMGRPSPTKVRGISID
jgi:hypothetical protein